MSDAVKALVKAQKAMGAVIKNAANPHLKSKYADLGSVLDACQSALHDNGFAIMQPCGKDEQGAFVETVLAHESGYTFASRVYLVIGKQDMQGVGSAITYARRYGLLGMAGLAPEDDDGEATKAPRGQALGAPPDNHARFEKAVTDAVQSTWREKDVESLAAWWVDLQSTAFGVASDPRVIAAKDAAKARLSKPNADLDGDHIPGA